MRLNDSIRVGLVWLGVSVLAPGTGRSESLEDAWSVALAASHRLAAAQLDEAAAAEDHGAAAAERMPNLSLRSAYTVRSDEPNFVVRSPVPGFGTFEFPYAQRNSASAGAEALLPLYTGGRISSSIHCAEAREIAAQFDTAQERLDLLFAVGEAYINVLRIEREVEVAEHDLQSLEAHSADVTRLHSQERASQQDVLAADVAASAARQRRQQQLRALEVARAQYNRLLCRPLSAPVTLDEIQLTPLEWNLDQMVEIACERRPDLQGLLAISDSHDFASESARAAGRPQVTASLGANFEENRYATPDSLATAAVVVDWNLFNGGKTGRRASAEQARAAGLRRLVDDLKSQIALDLLAASNEAAAAAEQLEVASQTLAHTTENLRVTQLRFGRGMALNADVLDAEARWSQAMRDRHNAHFRGTLAHLRLKYLAGLL